MSSLARRTRRWCAVVFLAAVVCALCACARAASEIGIGLIAMLEGQNAANGRDMRDAAVLAVDAVNANGGLRIGGSRVKVDLLVEEDPNTPEGALDAARKLMSEDRVVAIVGPQFSGNAIPVARLAESDRVVMIAPMSTNPETTAGKSFVFRVPFLDTFQGLVVARLARERLRAARAAVLFDVAGDYNRTLADEFRKVFQASGGSVTAFETYTSDRNTDFTAQLRRIAAGRPDVLFLPNYAADVRRQAEQARVLGVTAILLGGDGWDRGFAAERTFDGSYAVWQWHPSLTNPKGIAFVSSYRDSYRRPPEDVAATTYDAFGLLFSAMEAAGSTDPEAVRTSIRAMGAYEGVTGRLDYSRGGDPRKSAVVARFNDGTASVYAVIEP